MEIELQNHNNFLRAKIAEHDREEQQQQHMTGNVCESLPASQTYDRNFFPVNLIDSSHQYSRQDHTALQLVGRFCLLALVSPFGPLMTPRPYEIMQIFMKTLYLGTRPSFLRIEFSPTENLSYTPNLGVGAPFQVPPPSGHDLKITGRSKSTQSVRKTEDDVIKVSPSVPKIYTETFWRPPWGRVANPNGDHEEHGGTTKHQKDDNKQRRAFGLNITTPYQHQEISLKRRLHSMSYHLYMEHLQQDKCF
ncbi:hypothetical protein V8G54_036431 [Vigna mungo]|uniref:Uncharacterized protein n=1 Tax=Vigna mungo TaxID=3915 RepID=A0AAQ3MH29_VIGMU